MAEVTLRQVRKSYGPVAVIEDLDLDILDRELLVLVGPSGCGKSTALRMIAGLEEISGGAIEIRRPGGNRAPPRRRRPPAVFPDPPPLPPQTVPRDPASALATRQWPRGGRRTLSSLVRPPRRRCTCSQAPSPARGRPSPPPG